MTNRTIDTSFAVTRPSVPALDAILGHSYPVLDHGFVRVIDYLGDQNAIVQAARVSYGTGTKSVSSDRSLIRYLLRHHHNTPVEMAELKLHCKLPIFIARQWLRTRTASTNEYSGRYSIMSNEFYLPPLEQVSFQSETNNQGRGEMIPAETAQAVLDLIKNTSEVCYQRYEHFVEDGLSRELARIGLTLNSYTEFYWKIDLHNLLHFLHLRMDTHAQWEIRVYAQQIFEFLKLWVPDVVEAFTDYTLEARTLSKQEIALLKRAFQGEILDQSTSGLSKREWTEFQPFLTTLTAPEVDDGESSQQILPFEVEQEFPIESL